MKLENAFDVPAPPEVAWKLLNDVPRVISCMPGAHLEEVVDDDTFKVTMHVKLGPIALQFATDVRREVVDEAARRVSLSARARDTRGRGGASATITSTLEPSGVGTRVSILTDVQLQGAIASVGGAAVGPVSSSLVAEFAECIAEQLRGVQTPAGEAREVKPIRAYRLFWHSLVRLIRQ